MFDHISNHIQAGTLRFCFGLVFAGLIVAAHTAQSTENQPATDPDSVAIEPAHADATWLHPYRLYTDSAFNRSADAAPVGPGFGNMPRVQVAAPPSPPLWPTNARWQFTRNTVSLLPQLHFESNDERIEIKPRRHSVTVIWRKAF